MPGRLPIDARDKVDEDAAMTLTPMQLAYILRALRSVGEYGEVRLIVSGGRIRFIQTVQSLSFPQKIGNADER